MTMKHKMSMLEIDTDEDGVDLEVHNSKDNENEMVHSEDADNEIIMEDTEEIPEDLTLGIFVIVEYEEELLPGKVLRIVGDSIRVSCMKNVF